MHTVRLAWLNRTIIENEHPVHTQNCCGEKDFCEGKEDIFELKRWRNLREIFGGNLFYAILPVWTTLGDGHHFESFYSNEMKF